MGCSSNNSRSRVAVASSFVVRTVELNAVDSARAHLWGLQQWRACARAHLWVRAIAHELHNQRMSASVSVSEWPAIQTACNPEPVSYDEFAENLAPPVPQAESDDEDLREVQEDWQAALRQQAHELRAEELQRRLAEYTTDVRGYVLDARAQRIGRIYSNLTRPGASSHVACFQHAHCSVWVTMRDAPDSSKLKEWVTRHAEFPNAMAHKMAFNQMVYGNPLGPRGHGRPGG